MPAIYEVDCAPLENPALLAQCLPYLDNARRQQVERLPSPKKRAQCAAAGWLLTHLFGENGCPPVLTHGSRGKPYLAHRREQFSLSHTGRWVFCAVSEDTIGLDAQLAEPCRPKVAARCFTAAEQAWMNENPDERFTRLWVLKEAYLKFTGFGLVLPMHSFTVPVPTLGWDQGNHCYWQELTWRQQGDTVSLGICHEANQAIPAIMPLSLDDFLPLGEH